MCRTYIYAITASDLDLLFGSLRDSRRSSRAAEDIRSDNYSRIHIHY